MHVAREHDAETVRHDLSFETALCRLPLSEAMRNAIANNRTIPFSELLELPINSFDPISVWDFICLASQVIDLDYRSGAE